MPNTYSDNKNAPVNYLPSHDDDEIDLGELLATLSDSKWLIAFTTVIVLVIGIAVALLYAPVYQVDAMLQVEENSPSLGALEPVADLMGDKVDALTEIELIKSRMILGAAVKALHLEIIAEPKYFPVIGAAIARRFQKNNNG